MRTHLRPQRIASALLGVGAVETELPAVLEGGVVLGRELREGPVGGGFLRLDPAGGECASDAGEGQRTGAPAGVRAPLSG